MIRPARLAVAACALVLPATALAQGRAIQNIRTGAQAGSQPKEGGADGAPIDFASGSGVYGVDRDGAGTQADEAVDVASDVPAMHTVKKGDTLWGLCQQYFQDPWRWPQVWAENPLVTNPHWIFPGDVVRLRAGEDALPEAGPAPAPLAGGPSPLVGRPGFGNTTGVNLREIGFVDPQELAAGAKVDGSREEKIMLYAGDQVYIRFPAEKPLRAGERYSVYTADTKSPVKHPATGETLGYLVHVHGDVVIDQVTDGHIARGTLADTFDVVERGYLVGPLFRQFKNIEPRNNGASVEGQVVATVRPTQLRLLGYGHFAVIDRGRAQGVEVGNRFFVIRRGDGYRPIAERKAPFDTNFPKEVVGEFLIIDVRDNLSIAWLQKSAKEIGIGDHVEMRRGY